MSRSGSGPENSASRAQPHAAASGSARGRHLKRRELVKVLAAVSGATAAHLLLPSEWEKPVVGAGLLPPHAQASLAAMPIPCICGRWTYCARSGVCRTATLGRVACEWIEAAPGDEPGLLQARFSFAFDDAHGNMIPGQTALRIEYRFADGMSGVRSGQPHTVREGPFSGSVETSRSVRFTSSPYVDYTFWLTNACGRESAPLSIRVSRPADYAGETKGEERG